jgi:hypothetical protein
VKPVQREVQSTKAERRAHENTHGVARSCDAAGLHEMRRGVHGKADRDDLQRTCCEDAHCREDCAALAAQCRRGVDALRRVWLLILPSEKRRRGERGQRSCSPPGARR